MNIVTKCSICGAKITINAENTTIFSTYGIKCQNCKKKIASKIADLKATSK